MAPEPNPLRHQGAHERLDHRDPPWMYLVLLAVVVGGLLAANPSSIPDRALTAFTTLVSGGH
ncbi:hypothetical protein [Paramagnetospirillum kuznetsovii]|nr:hypothetical protein [Paramagnetospirillum kuznetsovii]